MKKLIGKVGLLLAGMVWMAGCAPQPVFAQSVSQTFDLTVAATNTAMSGPFNNVGQSAHQVYACVPGTTKTESVEIELDASNDGVNYFAISNPLTLTYSEIQRTNQGSCGTVSANGYYAAVQLRVLNTGSNSAEVVGVYSGSLGSFPIGGEARSASSATKVSVVPVQGSQVLSALSSTATGFGPVEIPGVGAFTTFVYGLVLYNPNTSAVLFTLTGKVGASAHTVEVPVPASTTLHVPLANPVPWNVDEFDPQPTIACTAYSGGGAPATDCFAEILFTATDGVASQLSATGAVKQLDNSLGTIPH